MARNPKLSIVALAAGTLASLACQVLRRGPTETDVVAAVRKTPPAPPTVIPTYLAEVESVKIEERGEYNSEGRYWPVRVRIKGSTMLPPGSPLQLVLRAGRKKDTPTPVDFVETGRFSKDDFGKWQVTYSYGTDGPSWRATAASDVEPR